MFTIDIDGKTYKIRYGYRVLCKTDLIDRLAALSNEETQNFQSIMNMLPELLLAGLQKYHSDEFGYDTEKQKNELLSKIYDMLDDYEDENADSPDNKSGVTLWTELQDELMKTGFLSKAAAKQETAEETSPESE